MKLIITESQLKKVVIESQMVRYDNRIEPSESVELDERGKIKTDQEWISEFKKKYPNWDYSNSKIYYDGNRKKIKNVYCKKHNHIFPTGGKEGILLNNHLNNGTGCYDCSMEEYRKKRVKPVEQWKKELSQINHLKDKCDFSESNFSYVEPLDSGPLVSHTYCKIHKKYFNGGGIKNHGIRANKIKNNINICPDCIMDHQFVLSATPIEDWIKKFKKNKRNKNYDFSRTKVDYITPEGGPKGVPFVYNIDCNVIGLNGKKHGLFSKEGSRAFYVEKGQVHCPKCICETKQINFINDAIKVHGDKYLYDKVDFCDPNSIVKKEGIGDAETQYKRKVLIGCKVPKHGYFFQDPWSHINRKQGCPTCRQSKGEEYIYNLLSSKFGKKITIKKENDSEFSQLGSKRFDFYIPELKLVIEYDGIGHFEPTFGTSDSGRNKSYNDTFLSDNLKNAIIKSKKINKNGIRLIRIPYVMNFKEIDKPLLQAIELENTPPNTVKYLGEYPRRQGRKEVVSKFQVNKPKLSLMNTLKEIN